MHYELLKKIAINDGFVIFPTEWEVIENDSPENSRFVGVVEVRHGALYNAPHFLFFSEIPIKQMEDREEKIMAACTEAFPAFKEILKRQVMAEFDENGKTTNLKQLDDAPSICIFPISAYGEATEFPCGAMVVRTCKG